MKTSLGKQSEYICLDLEYIQNIFGAGPGSRSVYLRGIISVHFWGATWLIVDVLVKPNAGLSLCPIVGCAVSTHTDVRMREAPFLSTYMFYPSIYDMI